MLTSLYAPIFFPGANLIVVFALGSIPAFAMAAVYFVARLRLRGFGDELSHIYAEIPPE